MKQALLFLFLFASLISNAGDLDRSPRYNLFHDYWDLVETGANSDEIMELNKKTIQEINTYRFETSPKRAQTISRKQAQEILDLTDNHEVVGPTNTYKYDPTGDMGFCFGRALFGHLELLRRGVQKQAIKKAFVVGPMYSGGIFWRFHVTTIVQGENGEWLAIDPYVGRIVTVEEWFDYLSTKSRDGKLRYYLSDANKVGPASWEYNIKPGGLFDPVYRGYFKDMFEYFRKTPVSCKEKFK